MADEGMTVREMLTRLQDEELLAEWKLPAIRDHLSRPAPPPGLAWYIRVLIGLGAWVAAGFFVAALSEAGLITWWDESQLWWGLGWIAAATLLRRFVRHTFFVQLALALSVGGHGMALFGAGSIYHEGGAVALVMALLCGALYPLYRDSTHRFLSVGATVAITVGWLLHDRLHLAVHFVVFAELVGLSVLFTARAVRAMFRPMGYACAVALPLTLLLTLSAWDLDMPWWPSSAAMVLWLLWLYRWCRDRRLAGRGEPMAIAVVGTVALGIVSTPGLLAALGLLVLGYALEDRVLTGLGVLFMPVFLIAFYYDLDINLGVKSCILMGTGLALLGARWVLARRPWVQEEAT